MKKLSTPLLIITTYNVIQFILVIVILTLSNISSEALIAIIIGTVIVATTNVFLFKKQLWAWIAYLFWSIALFIAYDTGLSSWNLSYGFEFNTSLAISTHSSQLVLGFDVVSLGIIIVLLKHRKALIGSN